MALFLFHLSDVFLWFVWVVFFVAAKGHDPQVCSCLGLTLPDHYQIGCAGGMCVGWRDVGNHQLEGIW